MEKSKNTPTAEKRKQIGSPTEYFRRHNYESPAYPGRNEEMITQKMVRAEQKALDFLDDPEAIKAEIVSQMLDPHTVGYYHKLLLDLKKIDSDEGYYSEFTTEEEKEVYRARFVDTRKMSGLSQFVDRDMTRPLDMVELAEENRGDAEEVAEMIRDAVVAWGQREVTEAPQRIKNNYEGQWSKYVMTAPLYFTGSIKGN